MGQAGISRTSLLPLLLSLSTFAINLVFCTTTTEISTNESNESQSTNSILLTSSSSAHHLLMNSVKIVDFVQLRENKREAEFIIDLVQEWNTTSTDQIITPTEIEFVKFRDVETLRVQRSLRNGVAKVFRKVKVIVPCHMKYTLYPHDSHECDLEMVQNQNETENAGFQVIWKWVSPYSMPICGPLETYDFRVLGYLSTNMEGIDSTLYKLKTDKKIPESVGTSNDRLFVRLIVERSSTKQIFSAMYTPALCITILSFFTLVGDSFPFRIATSVAYFLGLAIFEAMFWPSFPRGDAGDSSAIENYLAFCLGFVFQVVLTNVLLCKYLRNGDKKTPTKTISDATLEIEEGGGKDVTNEESSFSLGGILCCKKREKDKEQKVIPEEEHIMKKGKCHRFFYFRTLKPAHKQLPVWFFIFNVIYFALVLGYSGGLPTGFKNSPTKDDPNLCFQ